MRYIKLFENYKKAESIVNKHGGIDNLSRNQRESLNILRSNLSVGYYGQFVKYYLEDNIQIDRLIWVSKNLKNYKLKKQIDTYSFDELYKEVTILYIVKCLKDMCNKFSVKPKPNYIEIANILFDGNNINTYIDRLDINQYTASDFSNVSTSEEFVDLILFGRKFDMTSDWNILYEDRDYFAYEIMSYAGVLKLYGKSQCIQSNSIYDSYVRNGFKLINIIVRKDINKSMCIDIKPMRKVNVGGDKFEDVNIEILTWNNKFITKIENEMTNSQRDLIIDSFNKEMCDILISVLDKVKD